jgi:hypothetical protein
VIHRLHFPLIWNYQYSPSVILASVAAQIRPMSRQTSGHDLPNSIEAPAHVDQMIGDYFFFVYSNPSSLLRIEAASFHPRLE